MQVTGACTGTEIGAYVAGCLTAGGNCSTAVGSLSTGCGNCLFASVQIGDAQVPATGGLLFNYNASANLGPNYPGCIALKGGSAGAACAAAYEPLIQCIDASGCDTCTDTGTFQTCYQTIATGSGPCATDYNNEQTACAAEIADGGVANGGVCTTDTEVLSVICGNGSGDGG